jgi:hypothetical protein
MLSNNIFFKSLFWTVVRLHTGQMKALRQLTVLGFHAIREAPQGAPMGRRLAPIDIEHPKTLSQFRADQCLTRQRHALFGSIEVTLYFRSDNILENSLPPRGAT